MWLNIIIYDGYHRAMMFKVRTDMCQFGMVSRTAGVGSRLGPVLKPAGFMTNSKHIARGLCISGALCQKALSLNMFGSISGPRAHGPVQVQCFCKKDPPQAPSHLHEAGSN